MTAIVGDGGSATWAFSAAEARASGYTKGMKTAVSIPDHVFEGAEKLAKRTKKSRSKLFTDALTEYVARHAPEEITEAMNRVCSELKAPPQDAFAAAASRRTLARTEW
jgi:antitoxin MazE6